jgi:ribosomal protein S12 methylthiotransferase
MKIGVISLGCAKNLVDTENLLGILTESGLELTDSLADADAVIVNTCGFIASARQEALDTLKEVMQEKEARGIKVIAMGCMAQHSRAQLEAAFPQLDGIISLNQYRDLGRLLSGILGVPVANDYGKAPRVLSGKPWMAYVRIADGCNNRCSYCAIPLIRGPYRSRREEDIVSECQELTRRGVREINLIAQDSSMYGKDLDGRLHLSSLLRKLDAVEGAGWLRVLYLYPDEIPDDLIDVIASSRHILPYFDIPVQHGSDRMLKAMHRRGSRALIEERCAAIRRALPQAVLRTTLICGFPGESEEDHAQNLSLVRMVGFDHLGAFTFSREEGTPAADLPDDVPAEVKERRWREIMAAQKEQALRRLEAQVGTAAPVLVEGYNPLTRLYSGRSAYFAPDGVDGQVWFQSAREHAAGDFARVRFTRTSKMDLVGEEITDAQC